MDTRTYPPRLLDGPKSSLHSGEISEVCRERSTATHAAVVSARVGGHGRKNVRIDRDIAGQRLKKVAVT
jgi:hypothetical protein